MMKTMKMNKYFSMAALGALALTFGSCENGTPEFDDFEGGTSVYFARQNVERVLVLGNDETRDNTKDNEHIFNIVSTMGGAYNGKDITLDVAVDNSLCDNLYFSDGVSPVKPMPAEYYTLAGNTISYGGNLQGRLQVKLNDAFFADPYSVKNTYVIPLIIKDQKGAGKILTGTPFQEGETPALTNSDAWKILPQNYVLYCVKYMNPWAGFYLRRGTDKITENGQTTEEKRAGATIEKDEVCQITTKSLTEAIYPLTVKRVVGKDAEGKDILKSYTCNLKLTFANDGTCSVSSETEGVTATGTGKFVEKGAKLAWGNKDRDILTLQYTVDFGAVKVETTDQFVAQTRGNTNGVVTFDTQYIVK